MVLEKSFGHKEPNVVYTERIGAYGIGFGGDGKIPIVMTHRDNGQEGYFLLGGGLEVDEVHTDCITRECLEEAGLSVIATDLVCKASYYQFIERTKTNFCGTGYFYHMEIKEVVAEPTELDHYLVWLTFDEIKEKLFLPHQIWAVEQVYRAYKANRA